MIPDERIVVRSAAALIVGSELLNGQVRDENLFHLGHTLRALGIPLSQAVFCQDYIEDIAAQIAALHQQYDIVFTSGGVGPTHDDVTVLGVAQGLGVEVVQSPELAEVISGTYGENTTETHLLMARVPAGARLAETGAVRWPTIVAENVWVLPGIPQLFQMKLSVIREFLRGENPLRNETIYCAADEVTIKAVLDSAVKLHPQVTIGSYPALFNRRFQTRLTLDSADQTALRLAADYLEEVLGQLVVSISAPESP